MALRLAERWTGFWFRPVEPTDLGFSRFLFFGYLFIHSFTLRQLYFASAAPYHAYWIQDSFFELLDLAPPSSGLLLLLSSIWTAALALSCVGLLTRWSTLVAFVLGLYLLAVPNQLGWASPEESGTVLVLAALALSRCGDHLSVDGWLRRRAGRPEPVASGEYHWPLQFGRTVLSLILMSTAIAKLYRSGLEWIFSSNMTYAMLDQWYHEYDLEHRKLGLAMVRFSIHRKWFAEMMAAFAVFIELGHPLSLFFRRARWIWVPGGFLLFMGIRNTLGFTFDSVVILHVFWVPWSYVGRAVQTRMSRR